MTKKEFWYFVDKYVYSIQKMEAFSIVPFKTPYDFVNIEGDSVFKAKNKDLSFIVSGYKDYANASQAIDSFVCNLITQDSPKQYNTLYLHFYKKSYMTNIENLKNNPKDFEYYTEDDDLVMSYDFLDGHFSNAAIHDGSPQKVIKSYKDLYCYPSSLDSIRRSRK